MPENPSVGSFTGEVLWIAGTVVAAGVLIWTVNKTTKKTIALKNRVFSKAKP